MCPKVIQNVSKEFLFIFALINLKYVSFEGPGITWSKWAGSFVDCKHWKKVAVNLNGLAFMFILNLTLVYVLSQSWQR